MSGRRIGVVLLAAGRARRFGSDKRFARLTTGETLLERSVSTLAQLIAERVLVIGCDDDPARFAQLLRGWTVVRAEDSAHGMGESLAAAVRQLPAHWDGCLVALADKPWVHAETVRAVRDALGDAVVVPRHRGEWGHPVGFPRRLFSALEMLSGESGGRQLIVKEGTRCCFVDVDDPGVLLDVDTPDALRGEPHQAP
jgi:molybdenum cofactor cytidylyltransferase